MRLLPLVFCAVLGTFGRSAAAFEHHHGLGIGYQSAHITGRDVESFHVRSFPLSYVGRYGGEWGVDLRLALLMPLRARQADLAFPPRAEYDRTQQYDAFLAPTYRFSEILGFDVESGIGAHFHYVRFQSTEYVEWSSAALGLGASAAGRTPITREFWGGNAELSLMGQLCYDFIDLSRGGEMTGAVHAQALVAVGFTRGRRK